MCVIIHKPKGVALSKEDTKLAMQHNSDGFGWVYHDPKTGLLESGKGINFNVDSACDFVDKLTPYEALLHFRIRTHGAVSDKLCHPFKILDKEVDGQDLYFCHNGIISAHGTQAKDESDTTMFMQEMLHPLLKNNPDLIKTEAFQTLIEGYIGKGNKLAFMNQDGEVFIYNRGQGSDRKGCWVSNTYSFVEKTPVTTYVSGYWDRYKNQNKQQQDKGVVPVNTYDSLVLDGVELFVGDEVYLLSDKDVAFFEEAEVYYILPTSFSVKLKSSGRVIYFYSQSGKCCDPTIDYSVLPYSYTSKKKSESSKTISQIENDTSSATNNETADEKKEDVVEDYDKADADSDSFVYTFEGHEFDVKAGYGGIGLVDSLQDYGDEDGDNLCTLADIYNLSYQDRVNYFINNPEICYNMWQDLIEKLVLDDVDSEVLTMDSQGNVFENVFDTDYEGEEQDVSKSSIAAM